MAHTLYDYVYQRDHCPLKQLEVL